VNQTGVDTDYVEVPIFPDLVDNFPDFTEIRKFDFMKSQLSYGLYPPLPNIEGRSSLIILVNLLIFCK